MSLKDTNKAWERYWSHGAITSFANAFTENYQGAIRIWWQDVFARPAAHARVVDIGTGNGAVALLARDFARAHGHDWDIHACDQAAIRPARTLAARGVDVSGVEFHGEAPSESLPLADASVDLITGQFALEYGDVEAAVAEFARVLKPGAYCAFVLHHRDSVVARTTREELRLAQAIFEDTAFFDKSEALLRKVLAADTAEALKALATDADAELAREAFNQAASRLSELIASSSQPDLAQLALGYVGRIYENRAALGLERGLAELETARDELLANVARLRDLHGAMLDAVDLERVLACFAARGFSKPVTGELRESQRGNMLLGWTLRASLNT